MSKLVLAAVVIALLVAVPRGRAQAAAGIRVVTEPSVESRFPDSMIFAIEVESDVEIKEVRLRYTFLPDNRPATAKAEFEPGSRVRATFQLRSGTSQLYIPPGKSIRYSWEITDAAGTELKTDERDTSFADNRFKWQQVVDGIVQVNFYRGTQRDAEVMAQIAHETIDKSSTLMGTTFDFPIKIWAYANQKDFQIALAHASVTSDPGVLGQAHEPDTFIMVVDRLSSPSALDTMRHELTHLVTARALQGGPFKGLYPSWLNEGTSVFEQVSPNDVGYVDELEKAIRNDAVVPILSLGQLQRTRDVGLFYGESYALVKYLVATYGSDKFAQMIAQFKQIGNEDQTFQKVYGVDRAGLYRAWRESVGLKPEPAAKTDQNKGDRSTASPSKGTDTTTIALVIGATAAFVLLLGGAVAGGLLLARRAQPRDHD